MECILTLLQNMPLHVNKSNKYLFLKFQPERDPNAPKKPCNAFFQFCQEQRPVVVAEANSEIGAEPTKQEVTRQLASRWRALTNDEKRVSLNISFVYYLKVALVSVVNMILSKSIFLSSLYNAKPIFVLTVRSK